jgi:hypothetical protein
MVKCLVKQKENFTFFFSFTFSEIYFYVIFPSFEPESFLRPGGHVCVKLLHILPSGLLVITEQL